MPSTRVKSLLSDVAAFALSGASIKLLSFFMVPLYTYFLSTEEYAVADLVTLGIQLAIPLLTLSISDAVLRFGLEADADRESVFGIGFAVVLCGSVVSVPACLVVGGLSGDWWLACFSFLLFFVQNLCNYFAAFFKCVDKTKLMAIISSVSGIAGILLNVGFIAGLRLGLHGYWLGNVLGSCVGLALYLAFGGWRSFGYLRKSETGQLRRLLTYSVPLIPNSLFWWINSSMDRFILTALSTLSFVGLYSVASKIPQILSTVASFFFQAWNISVFRDFGTESSARFFKRGLCFISFGSFLVAGALIVINIPLASLLFSGDFFEAWKLVPLLLTATAVSIMNQFLGSVFTASKETQTIFTTTAMGSAVNIILNVLLILAFGGIGAVVATLASYLVVYVARAIRIWKRYDFLGFNHIGPCVQIVCLVGLSALSMSGLGVFELGIAYLGMVALALISLVTTERMGR